MQYNTDDIPIKNEYYYIISFGNFLNLTLYSVYFINKRAAERALSLHMGKVTMNSKYQVMRGFQLKQFWMTYTIRLGKLTKFHKYDYESGKTRKNQRTMARRRLRRMGMLTLVKPKIEIREKVKYSLLIKNKQKVSSTKNTSARAFRLQRKPQKFVYVILKKERSKTKGFLFRMRLIRIDLKKNCQYDIVNLSIQNIDLITPYLIKEVLEMVKNNQKTYEKILKYCAKRDIDIYKGEPKRI